MCIYIYTHTCIYIYKLYKRERPTLVLGCCCVLEPQVHGEHNITFLFKKLKIQNKRTVIGMLHFQNFLSF